MPYTSETLRGLGCRGVRSVDVMCPAFAADCLETLEEMPADTVEYFTCSPGEKVSAIQQSAGGTLHVTEVS